MYEILLQKLDQGKKKYKAVIYDKNKKIKTIRFGAANYEDFTTHQDEERKQRYIKRHSRNNEKWNDIFTAGFWSRWLLWNQKTILGSKKDIEQRFEVKFI